MGRRRHMIAPARENGGSSSSPEQISTVDQRNRTLMTPEDLGETGVRVEYSRFCLMISPMRGNRKNIGTLLLPFMLRPSVIFSASFRSFLPL